MPSREIALIRQALQAHSRLRWPRWLSNGEPGSSAAEGSIRRHFPLIGGLIASLSAIAYAAAALALPHGVAVLLAMSIGLWLTGARAERALARFADTTPRDGGALSDDAGSTAAPSVLGAGVVVVVIVLIARLEMLVSLDPSWIGVSLVSGAMFSRACAALLVPESDGEAASAGQHRRVAASLGSVPAIGAALYTGEHGAFVLAAVCALAAAMGIRRGLWRRGLGDESFSLNATQVASELGFLLGLLAMLVVDAPAGPPDAGIGEPPE